MIYEGQKLVFPKGPFKRLEATVTRITNDYAGRNGDQRIFAEISLETA